MKIIDDDILLSLFYNKEYRIVADKIERCRILENYFIDDKTGI